MATFPAPTLRAARRAALAALCLSAALGWGAPAHAQTRIAALVNGTPVTSTAVNERRAFVKITQRKDITARAALDILIEEELVRQEGKRRNVSVSDSDVDQRYQGIASNMKLSTDKLGQALAQSGASARTFKDNIRFQLMQRKLVTARLRTAGGIPEKDIALQMSERKAKGEANSYRFVIQQLVFVVPQGSSPALLAQRRNEAESFRKRVNSCDAALAAARGMRDVAAKPRLTRLSGQLGGGMRDELAKLPVGGSLTPSVSEQGVELAMLCDKKDAPDDNALRSEIQNEMAGDLSKKESEDYVAELRKKAIIQYR